MIATVALAVGATSVTSAAPPTPSPTQIVGQLEIAGVAGEGSNDGYVGAVEVRSFDFSASSSFRKLEVVAGIDSASVGLLEKLAKKASIPTVKLALTKNTGAGLIAYKTYILSSARVVSLREFASGQGSDIPLIEVGISYRKTSVEYRKQSPDGSLGDPLGFCWDLGSDSEC